ncbi:hypothetical protein F3Y22_tig00110174pilonHSYRG00491 [Hibiscus syriacus]|uniref:Uncharacterized protein n=1 Tax=Hibiscus syriacus TaxID=106335 RepID=A0A6A3BFE4_HIBSY|nr:hypothetical protein F3Y22_tig00110174pilonHSYRG00491 [Hibiscus syriacus]
MVGHEAVEVAKKVLEVADVAWTAMEDPSWWVWVTDEMVPSNVEEWSGIDDENYIVVTEEHVVDGVANFMAKCILSNPKAQTLIPEQLQRSKFLALFTCFMPLLPK